VVEPDQSMNWTALQWVVAGFTIGFFGTWIGTNYYRYKTDPHSMGIYESPDHQATYLAGEACTVNWSEDPLVFRSRLMWCAETNEQVRQHLPR